jgi:hypothetical protein
MMISAVQGLSRALSFKASMTVKTSGKACISTSYGDIEGFGISNEGGFQKEV